MDTCMANNGGSDDFFDQIMGFPPNVGVVPSLAGNQSLSSPMMLQLNSGGSGGFMNASGSVKSLSDHLAAAADPRLSSSVKSAFEVQSMTLRATPHQPANGQQKKRAKRGQATDPHSIAERLRRTRIAERIGALQEIVPCVNKTDRATMLDEIVDYVKFLRLQVKVLSMSRLGGAGAVAPLVTDIPISSLEEEVGEDQRNQQPWEKWSNDGTERQVAKLMEENVGAAMQLLQSKALWIMPISLASAIYHAQPPDSSTLVNPESDHNS